MSQEVAPYFLEIIAANHEQMAATFSEEARAMYERGLDALLMYRGDPSVLMQALQIFAMTGNRDYFLCGGAQVISFAAYISGNQSDDWAEGEARKLYNRARSQAGGRFEIDVFITQFINQKDTTAWRNKLDDLSRRYEAETSIRYALAELSYHGQLNNMDDVEYWFEQCIERAENDIQRLFALNRVAGIHLDIDEGESSIPYYQKIVTLDPNDPWAWHNMSYVYHKIGNLEQAGVCNRRALDAMRFGNALYILKELVTAWEPDMFDDPLEDVPRYPMTQAAVKSLRAVRADAQNNSGLFGGLFGG